MKKHIGIYKANKNKTGSVAQFKMAGDNSCMFLELARQIDDMDSSRPYDWENKIIVKLGITDICKLMGYFRRGSRPDNKLDLFHQTDKDSKAIKLTWQDKYSCHYMNVSCKTKDSDAVRIGVPISIDEVELLMVAFSRALIIILGWD